MDRAHRVGKSVGHRWSRIGAAALAVTVLAAVLPAAHAQRVSGARQGRVRVIAPSIVTGPEVDTDHLQRIAPRAPLGASRIAPVRPENAAPRTGGAAVQGASREAEDGMTTLFRPIASAAGRLEADGHVIAIAGIDPVEADRTCGASEGGSWPCGMRARTAFRYWLRGRAVVCDLENARKAGDSEIAECDLAGKDVGAWLVDHGWALADPDGRYAQAGKAAREAGRGVFGGGRADAGN